MEDAAKKNTVVTPRTFSPLHGAVKFGKKELVVTLITEGADVNAQDFDGKTPIFYAVNLQMVQLLVNNVAVVSSQELLNAAVQMKHVALVEYLLDHGANVTASDQRGRTALHEALYADVCPEKYLPHRKRKITRLLLQRGAQVNAITSKGTTALHAAATMGCIEAVKVLLEFHADVFVRNSAGETALELAAEHNNLEIVRMLLKRGDGVKSKSKNGILLFHKAAKEGDVDVVKVFLDCGANINGVDKAKKTALHYAAEEGHEKTVYLLLSLGAVVNCRDAFNETPLHKASFKLNARIVNTLLLYGADVNALSVWNVTAWYKAVITAEKEFDDPRWSPIMPILTRHIIMRKAANLFVRPKDNIGFFVNLCSKGYFPSECKAEIEIMVTEKIRNFSYYDILTCTLNKLTKYVENEDMSRAFQSGAINRKFPIYGKMLSYRFCLGKVRAEIMKLGNDISPFFHVFPNLPTLCTDLIMDYLSNDDLIMFIEACEPAMAHSLKLACLELMEKHISIRLCQFSSNKESYYSAK